MLASSSVVTQSPTPASVVARAGASGRRRRSTHVDRARAAGRASTGSGPSTARAGRARCRANHGRDSRKPDSTKKTATPDVEPGQRRAPHGLGVVAGPEGGVGGEDGDRGHRPQRVQGGKRASRRSESVRALHGATIARGPRTGAALLCGHAARCAAWAPSVPSARPPPASAASVDVVGSCVRWGRQWLSGGPRAGTRARLVRVGRPARCPTSSTTTTTPGSTSVRSRSRSPSTCSNGTRGRRCWRSATCWATTRTLARTRSSTSTSRRRACSTPTSPTSTWADASTSCWRSRRWSTWASTRTCVDDDKPARAIERLRAHVAPGGLLWVTHPGRLQRRHSTTAASRCDPASSRMRALRRERTRNVWREVPLEQVWGTPYDRLLYTAHAVVVVEIDAPVNRSCQVWCHRGD